MKTETDPNHDRKMSRFRKKFVNLFGSQPERVIIASAFAYMFHRLKSEVFDPADKDKK